jgi:hypothetical protein
MIKQMWENILTCYDLNEPLVAHDELDDVVALMIELKIDPQKFSGNLYVLLKRGRLSMSDILKEENSLPTTPSISKFIAIIDRPIRIPLWPLAAFPDVIDWAMEQKEEVLKSKYMKKNTEEVNSSIDKDRNIINTAKHLDANLHSQRDSYWDEIENASSRVNYYRKLISYYKKETDKALEVSVLERSEKDIYMSYSYISQKFGEESHYKLIATMTTKYYLELKKSYGLSFRDESSLLAMSGILDASFYIFNIKNISTSQIITLAKKTEGMENRLLNFIIRLEILLLSIHSPEFSIEEIRKACLSQTEAIRGSIKQTMDSYEGEEQIAKNVLVIMLSPEYEQLRLSIGVDNPTILH